MRFLALMLLAALYPRLFDTTFWTSLAVGLPGTLIGNQLGVGIYRRTGDLGDGRITLIMLGLAGAGLLLNLALARTTPRAEAACWVSEKWKKRPSDCWASSFASRPNAPWTGSDAAWAVARGPGAGAKGSDRLGV